MSFNIVTFLPNGSAAPIVLLLEEPWKIAGGLEPNINKATCSYLEFAKLNGNPAVQGSIGLWFSSQPSGDSAPDVVIDSVSIIDVDVAEVGIVPGTEAAQIVIYRLFLADFRQAFILPRGGRLEIGLINPQIIQSAAGIAQQTSDDDADAQDPNNPSGQPPTPAPATPPSTPNSELIRLCLVAMGIVDTSVPATVDNVEPPRGLQWFGNHAPTELAKLLLHCGHIFAPQINGTARIFALGNGDPPAVPAGRLIINTLLPGIDRRGKTVVFTSYPNAHLVTQNTSGPVASGQPGWEFVAQDQNGQWTNVRSLTICPDPVAFIKGNVAQVPSSAASLVPRLRDQLYYYLRYNPSSGTSDDSPVLTRVFDSDTAGFIGVNTSVAVQDPGTLIFNNQQTLVPVIHRRQDGGNQGNIIQCGIRLGQIADGGSDPDADFQELTATSGDGGTAPISIRITLEEAAPFVDPKGNSGFKPGYFQVGFKQQLNAITKLPFGSAELDNEISSNDPDLLIVSRPEWVLKTVDGNVTNQQELEDNAEAEAPKFLRNSGSPMQIIQATGFILAALNGSVSEIAWDQQKVMTQVKLNTWFAPVSGILNLKQHTQLMESLSAYPNQSRTSDSRTALGMSGATQPATAVAGAGAGPALNRTFWGVVQCTGPQGNESDFTNNRYWVALGEIYPTEIFTIIPFPIGHPRRKVVAVINLFENNDQTHFVRPGTAVRVSMDYDLSVPPDIYWTMICADEGTNNAAPCPAGSSSSSSSSSSGSSGSSTSSSSGNCITVVTNVQCVDGALVVTTANIVAQTC